VKHFLTLLRHEVHVLLISPSSYIAAVLFLVFMGVAFFDLLTEFTKGARDVSPAVDFFRFFWFPVLFMTPLLTMRSLAEERRMGTIETLMTTPVTTGEVVMAKFGAAYLFYLALWLSTASFHWVLYHFAEDVRLIDPGPLVGGYSFVALSGLMFIATGIFASSLTRSQLVAALLTFVMTVIQIAGGRLLQELQFFKAQGDTLVGGAVNHVQVFQHAEDFIAGVFDTRAPVYYLSMTGLLLFLTMLALDARSARS
jgi:ABC-2 type transport system permease protein